MTMRSAAVMTAIFKNLHSIVESVLVKCADTYRQATRAFIKLSE